MKRILFAMIVTVMHLSNALAQDSGSAIGQLHNTVLGMYYKQYGEAPSDIATLGKRLYAINKQLDPVRFRDVTESDVSRFTLAVYGTATLTDFKFAERGKALLNDCVSRNLLSRELSALMASFIDNPPSRAEMEAQADALLKSGTLGANDKKLLVDFKTLFVYSSEFWAAHTGGNQANARSRCNPGDQRSFADAFGGLIGGVLGSSFPGFGTAIGSFLGSQGMSAAIRMLQNHHGGGCLR